MDAVLPWAIALLQHLPNDFSERKCVPAASRLLEEARRWMPQSGSRDGRAWFYDDHWVVKSEGTNFDWAVRSWTQWRKSAPLLIMHGLGDNGSNGSLVLLLDQCFKCEPGNWRDGRRPMGVDQAAEYIYTLGHVGGGIAQVFTIHCQECSEQGRQSPFRWEGHLRSNEEEYPPPEAKNGVEPTAAEMAVDRHRYPPEYEHMPQAVNRPPHTPNRSVTLQECIDYTVSVEQMGGKPVPTSRPVHRWRNPFSVSSHLACPNCKSVANHPTAFRGPGLAVAAPAHILFQLPFTSRSMVGDQMAPVTVEIMDEKYSLRYVAWYGAKHFTCFAYISGHWFYYNDDDSATRVQEVVPPYPFTTRKAGLDGIGPCAAWYVRDTYARVGFRRGLRMLHCEERHRVACFLRATQGWRWTEEQQHEEWGNVDIEDAKMPSHALMRLPEGAALRVASFLEVHALPAGVCLNIPVSFRKGEEYWGTKM